MDSPEETYGRTWLTDDYRECASVSDIFIETGDDGICSSSVTHDSADWKSDSSTAWEYDPNDEAAFRDKAESLIHWFNTSQPQENEGQFEDLLTGPPEDETVVPDIDMNNVDGDPCEDGSGNSEAKDPRKDSMNSVLDFLFHHDEQYKVPKTNEEYSTMAKDAQRIIEETFGLLEEKFQARILPSGSFFEDLKVGKPDEFDFLAQITSLSGKNACEVMPSDRPGFVHVTVNEEYLQPWKECIAFICRHKKRSDQCEDCTGINPTEVGCTIILAPEKVQEKFRDIIDEAMVEVKLPNNWRHRGVNEPKISGYRRHGPANMFLFYYDTIDGKTIDVSLDVTLSIGLGIPVDPDSVNLQSMFRIPEKHRFQAWYEEILKKGVDGECPLQLIPLYSKLHVRTGGYGSKNCWRVSCSLMEREFLNRFQPQNADSLPKRCIRLCKWLRDKHLTDKKKNPNKGNIAERISLKTCCGNSDNISTTGVISDETIAENNKNDHEAHRVRCTSEFDTLSEEVHMDAQPDDYISVEQKLDELVIDEKPDEVDKETVTEFGGETSANPDYRTLPETDRKKNQKVPSINYGDFLIDADIPTLIQNFRKVFKPPPSSFRSSTFPNVGNLPKYSQRISLKSLNKNLGWVPSILRASSKPSRLLENPAIQQTEVSDMQTNPLCEENYGKKAYVTSIEIKSFVMHLMELYPFPEQWKEYQLPGLIIYIFKSIYRVYVKDACLENFFFRVQVIAPQKSDVRNTALSKLCELMEKMDSEWIPLQEEHPRTNFTDPIPHFVIPPRLELMALKIIRTMGPKKSESLWRKLATQCT